MQLARIGASVSTPATEVAYRRVTLTGNVLGTVIALPKRDGGWTARIPIHPIAPQATQTEEVSEW